MVDMPNTSSSLRLDDANYDPDDPENYMDVDEMVEKVTGEEPEAGQPFSIADEVAEDESAN